MSKVGRNDPCPCGSGLKYKKCHGGVSAAAEPPAEAQIPLSESGKSSGWLKYPAQNYMRFMQTVELPRDIALWALCAQRFGTPVLCLCCGTGREVFELARQGIPTVGVDLNASFLDAARLEQEMFEKETGRKLEASFHLADVVHMALGQKFPLVIMPTQSFQLLLTRDDQRTFFQTVKAHLADGGTFIFNFTSVFMDGRKLVNGRGERMGVDTDGSDFVPRILRSGPLRERLSTLDEVQEDLSSTGFQVVKCLGRTESIRSDFMEQSVPFDKSGNEYTLFVRSA